MARVSFPVGRQRLASSRPPWEQGYTRDIRGQMDAIMKNFMAVIKAIEADSPEALEYALKPIYDTSQELVPVRTGRLKASGFIEVRKGASGAQGVVGYARGGVPVYAVLVHERLDFRHMPPTQAKFLEEAVNRHAEEIAPRYAEFIRNDLGL